MPRIAPLLCGCPFVTSLSLTGHLGRSFRQRGLRMPSRPAPFSPALVYNAEAVFRSFPFLSSVRRASMMSSQRTTFPEVSTRKSGAASIAQASDAHEAKMARFSFRVRSGSRTTSIGCANALAGCKRESRSKISSFFFSSFLHGHSSIPEGGGPTTDHLNRLMV